ncbi:MAG TPA: hypothetical protein VGV59_20925 [Pyrinomonadaceae bacterium]|nr:hypothetical protein [Pyrinomonadaceae bacterium]
MDDQQGANRQGGGQGSGGEKTASKGINPVQHSERGSSQNPVVNPAQPSGTRTPAGTTGTPAAGDPSGGGVGNHE